MFKFEKRANPSKKMQILAPVIAIVFTSVIGGIIFSLLGFSGTKVVWQLFVAPLVNPLQWPDLLVKAAPLILIALGLSFGFRANIWNIGAEGQYVLGGIFATGVAIVTHQLTGIWILPLMLLAGVIGGMIWASVSAFLRVKYEVSEILSSLMLTYVAIQLLYYLVRGPWKDPDGYNFPQTVMFSASQTPPIIWSGTNIHLGVLIAFLAVLAFSFILNKTFFGFQSKLTGLAPIAARYAGISAKANIWSMLLLSGGMAGLAGAFEIAGPFGQLVPQFPTGYGFTAIIVAFLGRLNPFGILAAGLILAVNFVGGELAQTLSGLPQAATAVFQALFLFNILALDVFINYKMVRRKG